LKKTLHRIALVICFLTGIAFSLKTLREPDLWWQIRTGQWILENQAIPRVDMFSFTYEGTPWVNIKWGFEVIAAIVAGMLGPESVLLLQVLATMLILVFLLRTVKLLTPVNTLLPAALLMLLCGMSYRLTGRPEMVTHLFSVVFIFILTRHRSHPSRWVYALIPLQILWVNLHEAFATGIVITAIFTASAWLQRLIFKESHKPWMLTGVLIATVAAVAVNPYGLQMLKSPFEIYSQVFENKFTTELLGMDSPLFWQKEAWIALFMLCLIVLRLLLLAVSSKFYYKPVVSHSGIAPLLLVFAFAYLASTAYRNIILFEIVAFPWFIAALHELTTLDGKRITRVTISPVAVYAVTIASGIGLYITVVSGAFYRHTASNDRYGLQVLSISNPSGSAEFLRDHNLHTQRGFSDYLTSSYLLWSLQPSFKTFIDLRDLDVFPSSFFQRFAEATAFPQMFNATDSQYNFRYAVVFRPQFNTLHNYLYHDSMWSLQFVDAVAAVYVKDGKKDITTFTPAHGLPVNPVAYSISKLFNPLYTGYAYETVNTEMEAAAFYLGLNEKELARHYSLRALQANREMYRPLEMLGQIYYEQAVADTNPATRQMRSDSAMICFEAAYRENPEYAPVLIDLGVVAYRKGNMKNAIRYFEEAAAAEPSNFTAHSYAAEAYKNLANQGGPASKKNTELALHHYLAAERLNPSDMITKATIGFLYFNLQDCDKVQEYLSQVVDFPGLPEKDRAGARECLRRCGGI
jgi:tetratricopeptide (TPR) repeat protein